MRRGWLVLALGLLMALSSGCIINHSRKTYECLDGPAPAGSFADDFDIQVFGTSYSSNIFANDVRAPYEIHTRYHTTRPYRAYGIEQVSIQCGDFRQVLASPSDGLKATAERTERGVNKGSYHAEIELPRKFDHVPADKSQILTLELKGWVDRGSGRTPFSFREKYRYEEERIVGFATFEDLMGI